MTVDQAILKSDLRALAQLATTPAELDALLAQALDTLAELIPYDLAAVLELHGDDLNVRVARGKLASTSVTSHRISLRDFPTVRRSLETRRPIALLEHHHSSDEGDPYDGVVDLEHGHSCMVVPLYARDRSLGVMTFDRQTCEPYAPEVVELAGVYGQLVGLAFILAEQTQHLQRMLGRLREQNRLLAAEHHGDVSATKMLEQSAEPAMRSLVHASRSVAATDTPVLIRGETGTGKEVLAQAIHNWSPRRHAPMVKLNCAALPKDLIESELFGHVKGAFSGATKARPGRFLTADSGTLMLDEIGELPLSSQAKLLRVLQEGSFEPVGSDRTTHVDVRILAATHVDLEQAVAAGTFREDLYYRLNIFPVELPPLRARLDDLEIIANTFLARLHRRSGRGPWQLSPEGLARARQHSWPGNVREFINLLERETILHGPGLLDLLALAPVQTNDATPVVPQKTAEFPSLRAHERDHIIAALHRCRGKIYGPNGAAELLDIKPTTLQSRIKKHGIKRRESFS